MCSVRSFMWNRRGWGRSRSHTAKELQTPPLPRHAPYRLPFSLLLPHHSQAYEFLASPLLSPSRCLPFQHHLLSQHCLPHLLPILANRVCRRYDGWFCMCWWLENETTLKGPFWWTNVKTVFGVAIPTSPTATSRQSGANLLLRLYETRGYHWSERAVFGDSVGVWKASRHFPSYLNRGLASRLSPLLYV